MGPSGPPAGLSASHKVRIDHAPPRRRTTGNSLLEATRSEAHNLVGMSDATEVATSETVSFPFQVGLGGIEYQISIVPIFEGGVSATSAGTTGQYKVIVTLERPGFSHIPEHQFLAYEHNHGDSHLAIAPPALNRPDISDGIRQIEIQAQTADGRFVFRGNANDRGFLGTLVAESVPAENVDDAAAKVAKAIAPSLSNLSAHLDIPLRVQQVEIIELRTGARHLIFQVPYNDAPFLSPQAATLSDEFMRYASCYREALGSNTPAYQFLCYFKIIEALLKRAGRRATEAAGRGDRYSVPPERIPSDPEDFRPWLHAIFPVRATWDDLDLKSIFVAEARGKKLTRIVQQELRLLRDAVAHAVLENEEGAFSLDLQVERGRRLSRWLPLTKCIVRRLLKMEFRDQFLVGVGP